MSTAYYYGGAGGSGPLPGPVRYSPYGMDVVQPENPQYSQMPDASAPQWTAFPGGSADDISPGTDASSGDMSYGGSQSQSSDYYFKSLQNQLIQTTAVLKQLHDVVTKNDDAVKQNQLRLSQLEAELRNMIPAMQRIMRNLPQ